VLQNARQVLETDLNSAEIGAKGGRSPIPRDVCSCDETDLLPKCPHVRCLGSNGLSTNAAPLLSLTQLGHRTLSGPASIGVQAGGTAQARLAILGCQAKVVLACVLLNLGRRDYAQTLNRLCEARWRLASRTRMWSRSFFVSQRRYFVVADRGRLGATPTVSPLGHGPELSPPLRR
jgi:hypothetical protein